MAMTSGTVSVGDNGSVVSTGMAAAIFTQLVSYYDPLTQGNKTIPFTPDSADTLKGIAQLSTGLATAIVSYIQASATAVVPTTMSNLQTLPASFVAGAACEGPSVQKLLAIT